jgi:hypothetical protein
VSLAHGPSRENHARGNAGSQHPFTMTQPEKKKLGRPRLSSGRIVDGLTPEAWAQIEAMADELGVSKRAALRLVVAAGLRSLEAERVPED